MIIFDTSMLTGFSIVPVDRYLDYFQWDEAKHPHRRPLPEIVSIIQNVWLAENQIIIYD